MITPSYGTVTFNELYLSEENIRRAAVPKATDKETKASIAAVWLLQNIVVGQKTEQGYPVEAGGRRHRLIGELIEEGIVDVDKPIPVRFLQDGESAKEASLMENRMRAPSNPIDEWEAYLYLVNIDKLTTKEIAKRCGQSKKYVEQRLLLSNVHEKLRNLCRDGKMDLDVLEGFTVSDDQDKQLAAYNHYKNSFMLNARNIREFLLEDNVNTDDKRVKFVSLAVYKKRGGTITQDLFDNITYLNNIELLNTLVEEKIQGFVEKQGKAWKWVDYVAFVEHSTLSQYGHLNKVHKTEPTALLEQLKAKQEELNAIEQRGDDQDWPDEIDEEYSRVDKEVDQLRAKIEAKKIILPQEKPFAGCLLTLNYQGEVIVHQGLVKKEDKKALAEFQRSQQGDDTPDAKTALQADSETITATDESMYTQALDDDLSIIRHSILKAAIIKDADLGADLLAFSQCYPVFVTGYHSTPLKSHIASSYEDTSQGDVPDSLANEELENFRQSLDTTWVDDDMFVSFERYRALSAKAKKSLATFCAAYSLDRYSVSDNPAMMAYLLTTGGIDMHPYYRPSAQNFFKRVKGDALTAQAVSIMGQAWVDEHIHEGKQKRAWIIEQLDAAVNGKLDDQPHVDASHVNQWLPLDFI